TDSSTRPRCMRGASASPSPTQEVRRVTGAAPVGRSFFRGNFRASGVLHDQFALITISASPVLLILIAMAQPRFHALFQPKLRVGVYLLGWLVLLCATVFIRHADLVPRAVRALRPNAAERLVRPATPR